MYIIFLDLDGVINRHNKYPNSYCITEYTCVYNLNVILNKFKPKIVISSAWRYLYHSGCMTETGFKNLLLTHGIDCQDLNFDFIRPDHDPNESRLIQIEEYITNNHIAEDEYIIIDDLPLNSKRQLKTNSKIGLTMNHVGKAEKLFNLK